MTIAATTLLSSKGQVAIPEELRAQQGLEAGAQFVVIATTVSSATSCLKRYPSRRSRRARWTLSTDSERAGHDADGRGQRPRSPYIDRLLRNAGAPAPRHRSVPRLALERACRWTTI